MPEMRPYQRILALIDFNGLDRRMAEKAILLARLNRARLDFLHLIETDGMLDGGHPGSNPRATSRGLEAASLRRLNFLAAQLGVEEANCHALYGPLRQGFLKYVQAGQPDLIVTSKQHAYLVGAHDLLVLSPPKHPLRGKVRAWLISLFGSRTCNAGF
jgi:hypothetical protein